LASPTSKLKKSEILKAEGIKMFTEKKYKDALMFFDEGLKLLLSEDTSLEVTNLLLNLNLNICNCLNNLGLYEETIVRSDFSIKINQNHPKIYYYRALSYLNLNEFEKAQEDYSILSKLIPNEDPALEKLKSAINSRKYEKSKSNFKNILNSAYEDRGKEEEINVNQNNQNTSTINGSFPKIVHQHPTNQSNNIKKSKAIEKARKLVKKEELKLRQATPNMFLPENVFEEGVGHFWGYHETRPFMRAKYELIEALIQCNTRETISEALDESLDCLRLCRSDNMGVRSLVPSIYLKLNREQECYDFIKWWATCDPDGHYDWGDMSLPYLNIKNADIFEGVDENYLKSFDLQHLLALLKIKIRIYSNLQTLSRELKTIYAFLFSAKNNSFFTNLYTKKSILTEIPKYMMCKNYPLINMKLKEKLKNYEIEDKQLIKDIDNQIQKIFKNIHKSNKYVLPELIKTELMQDKNEPYGYSSGSPEEAYFVVKNYSQLWLDSKEAMEITRKKVIEFNKK
jgi:tetratricopeptide (TPR) repeat protein